MSKEEKTMDKKLISIISLLVMLVMACNVSALGGASPTGQVPSSVAINTPDPHPVTLNDGLASLNSYQMTITFRSVGPDPTQSSTTTIERQRSNESNASYTHFNMSVIDPGGGQPNITDSDIYQIGNDQCSGNSDGWTWTSSTPAQAEMQGLITNMIGLTPLIDNPTFVTAETINGIQSNHFEFKVAGLGATSGAVVNTNKGDYWLAIDGQYIVKYNLVVETSESAKADVLHVEISIEMKQVNQPVNIVFPQGCLDVAATPTP
jgi:hypothetical protein